jgi:GNAT superfamily N-acetyltransferase
VSLVIRAAKPTDCAAILALLRELAQYQGLQADADVTLGGIESALFASHPHYFCDVADWNGEPAGFAAWFFHYSTFHGRHGLHLEDLFVRPAWRRRGIGKALMHRLAQRCVADGLVRFEWAVMRSNVQSINFYQSIGAQVLDQWKLCRLSGPALVALAQEGEAS